MTAQIAEKLRYQGDDVAMCTNPLSDYFGRVVQGGHHAVQTQRAQLVEGVFVEHVGSFSVGWVFRCAVAVSGRQW